MLLSHSDDDGCVFCQFTRRVYSRTYVVQSCTYSNSFLEVKREYYQNISVLDCVTQCSQSIAHLCEQFLQVKQIGFVTLGPLHCA